jgi:Type I phosphodiesterase / nucleotide pyrophosphatase
VLAMLPAMQTVYQRLGAAGVRSHTFQSAGYTPSPAAAVALAGSQLHAFQTTEQGLADLAETLAGPGPQYCFAYIDDVDGAGHVDGPDSAAFDATVTRVLDLLEAWHGRVAGAVGDALLILTADHGQTAVDPATTMYVNRELPGIERLLRHGADGRPLAPAGSARDLFLHAHAGAAEELAAALRSTAGERASVHLVGDLVAGGLFGPEPSARLLDRLADVLVLPAPGQSAWWWEPGRYEQHFRGHHGGLTADEMEIPLGTLELS